MIFNEKLKKIIIYFSLAAIVSLNIWLYRGEFRVLVDPNDNIFQYALVDEAWNIWQNIFAGKLSFFYLLDSWQERWAEGFALSSYYSHLPQAIISLIGLISPIGMYKTFVVIRTLMLILLPLMFFWGGTILRLPSGFSLILALFSQLIFTDGLYGIDVSSFLWRGWGLSAQLMAVFFLPLAFAYTINWMEDGPNETNGSNWKKLAKAVFFNFLVAQAHFGIFSLALLGYPLYLLTHFFQDIHSVIASEQSERGNLLRLLRLRQLADPRNDNWGRFLRPTIIFLTLTLFSLSYFIIPFFLQSQYRNFSVWDPIWKFDSWGARQVIVWFLNGELFDFGRFSFISLCVGFGVFLGLGYLYRVPSTPFRLRSGSLRPSALRLRLEEINSDTKNRRLLSYLSLLFLMYLILFFGRTTLGKFIDFIPGLSEYHLHRVIVMVQFIGILLGAWFLYELIMDVFYSVIALINLFFRKIQKRSEVRKIRNQNNSDRSDISDLSDVSGIRPPISTDLSGLSDSKFKFIVLGFFTIISLIVIYYLEKPLVNYAKDNNIWIERSNKAYLQDLPAYEKIKAKLAGLPKARVYVGRPGNWGKQFTVGEVPFYMVLSRDGFPVIGFLPESWSPNSDPEEFFDENNLDFYRLYNVGYSVLPDNIKPPEFAKLVVREGKYLLYQIKTDGWFDIGESNIALKSKKTDLLNITRLWFGSNFFQRGDYPLIDLSKDPPDGKRWYIQMTDKNNFINLNDGKERNIWQANPFEATISSRSLQKHTIVMGSQEITSNGYKLRARVNEDCQNCLFILKQSFHPNWQVKVNGRRVETFPVFPFYLGVTVEKAGEYDVSAEYKPGKLKLVLVWLEFGTFGIILGLSLKKQIHRKPI